MHRFFTLILTLAAIATSVSARTLLPSEPAPYSPYLSELMMTTLSDDPAVVSSEQAYIDLGSLFKQHRLLNNGKPFSSSYCIYIVDSITPSFIDMRISEDAESLKNNLQTEEIHRLQLAALPSNGKHSLALLVSTLFPGAIPDSELCFYEFPSEKIMMDNYVSQNEQTKSLTASYRNYLISIDTVTANLRNYAYDAGILQQDTISAVDESEPIKPKILKTSSYIKAPLVADFFKIPSGTAGKHLKEAIASIPFPMISYEISPLDFSLTATLHYESLVSMELTEELKPYHIKELKYIWDGKRFKRS